MSQDNPARDPSANSATADALPVLFQGATLTLIDRDGEPYVAMRPLVEAMGLDWPTQQIKIKDRFKSTVGEIPTVAEDGKRRAMTCIPLRKLAAWLMTISPNKVRPDLRERIRAYQSECDDALWAYWQNRRGQVPAPIPPRPIPVARRVSESEAREALLFGWWTRYRTQGVRIRDLLGVVGSPILAVLCRADTLEGQATALARLVRAWSWSGRPIGGFRVCERASDDHRGPQWSLEPAAIGRVEPARLPPPLDLLHLPGVRRAINRRAHVLSRDCFEQRRRGIANWVRRCGQGLDPATLVTRIAGLQLADFAAVEAGAPPSVTHGTDLGGNARSADLPAPGRYAGAPPSALPFVADLGLWCVPPATNYSAAYARGGEYAHHVAAYLRDNREFAGGNLVFQILRAIAASGGLADEGPAKGYAAGFCSGIEMWAVRA